MELDPTIERITKNVPAQLKKIVHFDAQYREPQVFFRFILYSYKNLF